jgi:hypothetical protein
MPVGIYFLICSGVSSLGLSITEVILLVKLVKLMKESRSSKETGTALLDEKEINVKIKRITIIVTMCVLFLALIPLLFFTYVSAIYVISSSKTNLPVITAGLDYLICFGVISLVILTTEAILLVKLVKSVKESRASKGISVALLSEKEIDMKRKKKLVINICVLFLLLIPALFFAGFFTDYIIRFSPGDSFMMLGDVIICLVLFSVTALVALSLEVVLLVKLVRLMEKTYVSGE